MVQQALFPNSNDELLISVYRKQGRTLDDLPYTPEFEAIFKAMDDETLTRRGLFHRLQNLRKSGGLPRLGQASSTPPRIASEHEAFLADLVEAAIGKLGLRDQLPYTTDFDRIVCTFNAQVGLILSPHAVWRLIAKLAK